MSAINSSAQKRFKQNLPADRYKAVKKLRRACQKLTSRKRNAANKIVHELLEHEHVYMQDENLNGWHKGLKYLWDAGN